MAETLGFSISCYRGDVPFLRGCLSSIKYFAPDAPISLIIDGNFSTQALEKAYGVQVIHKNDVKNPDLRKLSYGYGLTKMIALWESPFDTILHLDADAVLWGDIRQNLPMKPWDFVYNEPHEVITDFIQKTQYFDPEVIFNHIEEFPWRGNPYFNSGVFCCRRNALDLDEYLRMARINQDKPGLFFVDQAMLNIMVFRGVHAGKLNAQSAHLQSNIPVLQHEYLEDSFQIHDGRPFIKDRSTVLHWAGPKPWKENRDVFRTPMDYFRKRGLHECGLGCYIPSGIALEIDEYLARNWPKYVFNGKKIIKRIIFRNS